MASSITRESHFLERKSLLKLTSNKRGYDDVARACVAFANAAGGTLLIGVEDGADEPPSDQRVEESWLVEIPKRVRELTVNVGVVTERKHHENGGEYIVVSISRSSGIASLSDGRYYVRVGDSCCPVIGDDVIRLVNERPSTPWEKKVSQGVSRSKADLSKVRRLCAGLRSSDRVVSSVKEKTDDELLVHYGLVVDGCLTNLGVLLVGKAWERSCLGTASIVQAIKYDANREKTNKWSWDDHELSPIELIDSIWTEVTDFRESYEIRDGLFRSNLPAYDETVVRELLVNAFVHRPYTQGGDIFLNFFPDR
ncbi:MAG: putative DNA binding domain-containing protein, partial [Polyangiaceae bacterium]|nr:putative DNA binding domain-containing protein [Polyangiaceae bacterium]